MNKYLVEYIDGGLICIKTITETNIKMALNVALLDGLRVVSVTQILDDLYFSLLD